MKGTNDPRNVKDVVTSWWSTLTPDVKRLTIDILISCMTFFICDIVFKMDKTFFEVIVNSFFCGTIIGGLVFAIMRYINKRK